MSSSIYPRFGGSIAPQPGYSHEEKQALLPFDGHSVDTDQYKRVGSYTAQENVKPLLPPPAELDKNPSAVDGKTITSLSHLWAEYRQIKRSLDLTNLELLSKAWNRIRQITELEIKESQKNSLLSLVETAYLGGLTSHYTEAIHSEKKLREITGNNKIDCIEKNEEWIFVLNTLENKAFAEYYQGQLDRLEISLKLVKKNDPKNSYAEILELLSQCSGCPVKTLVLLKNYRHRKVSNYPQKNNLSTTRKNYFFELIYAYALATCLDLYDISDECAVAQINACLLRAKALIAYSPDVNNNWLIQNYLDQIKCYLKRKDACNENVVEEAESEDSQLWDKIKQAYDKKMLHPDFVHAAINLAFLAIKFRDLEKCQVASQLLESELELSPKNILLLSAKVALGIYQARVKIDSIISDSSENKNTIGGLAFSMNQMMPAEHIAKRLLQLWMPKGYREIDDVISGVRHTVGRCIEILEEKTRYSSVVFEMKYQLYAINIAIMSRLGQASAAEKYYIELAQLVEKFKENLVESFDLLDLYPNKNKYWTISQRQKLIFGGYVEPLSFKSTNLKIKESSQQVETLRKVADNLILEGDNAYLNLPEGLTVIGDFTVKDDFSIQTFPKGLTVNRNFVMKDCHRLVLLPEGLRVGGNLVIENCRRFVTLPEDLTVGGNLVLKKCSRIDRLPAGLTVLGDLLLNDCENLKSLPRGIRVGGNLVVRSIRNNLSEISEELWVGADLILSSCESLSHISEGLIVTKNLNLVSCNKLASLPNKIFVGGDINLSYCKKLNNLSGLFSVKGELNLLGCTSLVDLPKKLDVGSSLILANCISLTGLPVELKVDGHLDLTNCLNITSLPNDILNWGFCKDGQVRQIYLKGTGISLSTINQIRKLQPKGMQFHLPEIKSVDNTDLIEAIKQWASDVNITEKERQERENVKQRIVDCQTSGCSLNLNSCSHLTSLPEGLIVSGNLDLRHCHSLTNLPLGLKVGGWLNLCGCTNLKSLPVDLEICGWLNLSNCINLSSLPEKLCIEEDLDLRGCIGLTTLSSGVKINRGLNLRDCSQITHLPEDLSVGGSLILAGCTGLTHLPKNSFVLGEDLDLRGCSQLTHLPDYIFDWGSWSDGSTRCIYLEGSGISQASDVRLQARDLVDIKFCWPNLQGALQFKNNLDAWANTTEITQAERLARCEARKLIIAAQQRPCGSLDLSMLQERSRLKLRSLPVGLVVGGDVNLTGCISLTNLPEEFSVGGDLDLTGCTSLKEFPKDFFLGGSLNLRGCSSLNMIPPSMKLIKGYLSLRGCTNLESLPEELHVMQGFGLYECKKLIGLSASLNVKGTLDLTRCGNLTHLPPKLKVGIDLNLTGCTSLTHIPPDIDVGGDLNLTDCKSITSLPEEIFKWGPHKYGRPRQIDLKGSGISQTMIEHIRSLKLLNIEFLNISTHKRSFGVVGMVKAKLST